MSHPHLRPGRLRLVSYNIRKALGTDRRRNPARICSVIAALEPDIVVLQEADLRLGARPTAIPATELAHLAQLSELEVAPFGQSARSLGWHGNAMLLRRGIELRGMHRLALPGFEPRGAIAADLDTPAGPLRVGGLHLGLLRQSRRLQLTHILDELTELPAMPTVLAGDLNEWSERTGLGRLARRFAIHAPGRSYHSRRPVAALDRIATSSDLVVAEAGVWHAPPAPAASDHLPIWADLHHA
ncbi:endonuclease/exonuclease/phosphatase family protein [Limimaricola pyoseonensis]|uniref:Metal-dependent hydrolase, endonuclease/exonuclease/phosphatase family n=1 Tax=Limimaricola pyoseonensis TaxID=521013 RepID=A0A1G7JEW3_9RHOB|nr:endonuclease/exonuclease/phosphatase family protein [Limimaricola pyoseonensis]SDF23029.1 Metal-dependent hydrolase, endonuclease/exonuclease/phosphatase family [Limimaricola pyoseonensis]